MLRVLIFSTIAFSTLGQSGFRNPVDASTARQADAPAPPPASAPPLVTSKADAQVRDPAEEAIVVERIRTANSRAVAPFVDATDALDHGRLTEALAAFEQAEHLASNQPDILRRKSWVLGRLGRLDDALATARRAVALDPSRLNKIAEATAEVFLLGAGPTNISDQSDPTKFDPTQSQTQTVKRHLDSLSADLLKSPNDADLAAVNLMQMYYAALAGNTSEVRYWSDLVLAKDPSNEVAKQLQAAIRSGSETRVGTQTESAKRSGGTVVLRSSIWFFKVLLFVTLIVLALIGLFLGAGELVSRRSLTWLARTDPNATVINAEPFRKPYRILIVLSGVLYSIVLPLFAILAVIPPLAASLAVLFLGRIPIGLMLGEINGFFCVLTHAVTRGSRRLFRRPDRELAGTPLTREDAPDLFLLLEELGRVVGTAPPDRVQLFPGTTLSVYETSNSRERVLNLGLGALIGLDQTAFAAIACHELGHYRGGDTSASMSARRAADNMLELSHKLRKGFFSVVLVWFLKKMWWVHSRVTLGAQRIQETLADRVAAQQFGAAAFERGLRHVYRREVEFAHCATTALIGARERGEFRSIYDPGLIQDRHRVMLDRDMNQALAKKTTVFDSHPSAEDRFREVRRVRAPGRVLSGRALDLFADPAALFARQDRIVLAENSIQSTKPMNPLNPLNPLEDEHFSAVYRSILRNRGAVALI